MVVRIVIKADLCFSCGLCYVLAPKVYSHDEEGRAVVRAEYRAGSPYEGAVPDELVDEAVRGMMTCPIKAIDVSSE